MAESKRRDDNLFNCSESYELDYVAGRYKERDQVKAFLIKMCEGKKIYHSTHTQVYALIKKELGFDLPSGG